MNFQAPGALWALLSLVLLALFSLWRQAAVRVTVPSLLLWKRIPERNPPLRALRRPRWRMELLLQALAAAAAVTALAGPYFSTDVPPPRKVALVFDTSARMSAGGRLEKAKEEAGRLVGRLRPGDETVVYWASPSPRRGGRIDDVRVVHAHVDTAPLLAAARRETENVIYVSDRAPEGVRAALFGGEGGNIGIEEFSADDREVFARIVNHGPARRVPLRMAYGSRSLQRDIDLASGLTGWHTRADFSGADEVSLELAAADHFPLDDAARAVRLGPALRVVSVTGRNHPLLVRARESIPGVAVRRGGGEALVSVGVDEEAGKAALRVSVESPAPAFVPQRFALAEHRLTAGMRGEEVVSAAAGELKEVPQGAEPLFYADGKLVGAFWDGAVRLSFEMNPSGWPATPSFPIFWANVVDAAAKRSRSFAVVRAGRPFPFPADIASVEPPSVDAIWSLSPGKAFLAHTVGVFRTGGRPLPVNLLDARESDTAGVRRPLDWSPEDPGGAARRPRLLGGHFAALSLALVVAAWFLQRRAD